MARGKRYILPGHTYHVTHRCHDREFLLKFARDRTAYRTMLRERLGRFDVSLFTYAVTSNHVHLLLRPRPADALDALSGLMQSLQGDFALRYNRRKGRTNAFWGDRYHATMIESGEHLWRCLAYIDLNRVRAGVVDHPREWPWTGYCELMGIRQRYRLLDLSGLVRQLEAGSLEWFRENYGRIIDERVSRSDLIREPMWTESLAVGTESFAAQVGGRIENRMRVAVEAVAGEPSMWTAREAPETYA